MNILIRADSSSKIGTGHIMRDLVLAKQYKQDKVFFVTKELPGNINNKIKESNYQILLLEGDTLDELDALIKKYLIDMVIIDHYEIDFNFEKNLKMLHPNIILMVLDDTYEQHFCDILLNHNINANKENYKNLVPTNCQLRCGKNFMLLRDEFKIVKKSFKKNVLHKASPFKIFIAMGGADTMQLNIPILKSLQFLRNIKIEIVTTTANHSLQTLKKFCKNKKWITLHINSNQIAKLISKSDFCITTPSVTVNEIIFLNIPFLAIKTANNQDRLYSYLKQKRHLTLQKFNRERVYRYIKHQINK